MNGLSALRADSRERLNIMPQLPAQKTLFIEAGTKGVLPFVDYDFPANPALFSGLVLVGEAPGREEARLGHPFVGRSGQILGDMLEKAGIVRQNCLVANVFRYQPPQNKVDTFFSSRKAAQIQGKPLAESLGKFGSAYCLQEYEKEINNLSETLKALHPKIVVALGRTPLWALTGENGLLSKVGSTLDCRLAPGIPVIPTYHPSFILRGNWGLQETWLEHLRLAAAYQTKN